MIFSFFSFFSKRLFIIFRSINKIDRGIEFRTLDCSFLSFKNEF
nr:MAG TPA: hypothetical protein [Caudoviricetes sp.]